MLRHVHMVHGASTRLPLPTRACLWFVPESDHLRACEAIADRRHPSQSKVDRNWQGVVITSAAVGLLTQVHYPAVWLMKPTRNLPSSD